MAKTLKISARKAKNHLSRVCQADIFSDFTVVENVEVENNKIKLTEIKFPYLVCLNQECDLERDGSYRSAKPVGELPPSNALIHLLFAPAFIYQDLTAGTHWDKIYKPSQPLNRAKRDLVEDNEIPRYHYLKFGENGMPELVIDFKHFFTVNTEFVYGNMEKRLCSLDDLFKEKVSQRFAYFLSRIGLPEELAPETSGEAA